MTKRLVSLQPGDVLIGCKLDRLGRSLHDLIALLDDLKAREVAFRSLMEIGKLPHYYREANSAAAHVTSAGDNGGTGGLR